MPFKDYTLKNTRNIVFTEDQNEIVDFLIKRQWAFNLAQTGFGKTLTSLSAYVHKFLTAEKTHCVIVIPVSAVKPFTDTIGNIIRAPYNIFTSEKKRTMDNALFSIFTYSALSNGLFTKSSRKRITNDALDFLFDLKRTHENLWLIADEAHALQNTSTAQYKTINLIKKLMSGGWFLTATPILNDIDGLFNMVDLVIPGYFGNILDFSKDYKIIRTEKIWVKDRMGKAVQRVIPETIGFKNLDVLKERFSKIGIVKSKTYNVKFNYRSTKLSEGMLKYYKWAANGIFSGTEVNKKSGRRTKDAELKETQDAAGARLHDLQRVVSNSHPKFKAIKDPDLVTEKELLLIRTTEEVISRNEATLIFFSYRDSLDRVKYILERIKAKYSIAKILEVSGDVSQSQRKLVEDAITPGSVVLITTAGTESMNLQKANNIIFYEIPFSLRQFVQGIGRITRMDSKYNEFNVYILEAEGTIDTYKKLRLVANAEPIKAVIGGTNALPAEQLVLMLADKKDMKNEYLWRT